MFRFCIITTWLVIMCSCGRTHLLREIKRLDHYPSASGLEFYDNNIYVIGDDATYMLILDTNLVTIDSVQLYDSKEKRIAKDLKPDLESISIAGWRSRRQLLLLGSGSFSPFRNVAWLIDPITLKSDSIRMDTFYQRLKFQGISEINLEGGCLLPGTVVLSNRGHLAYKKNYLIMTEPGFWKKQENSSLSQVLVGSNTDTSQFNGISGLAYAAKSDRLVMSVSTEATRSVYDDGAIGKSYIWIVKNISSKKRWKSVNPDQVIELDAIDSRLKQQKIESVCVIKETRHFLHLILAADNDDGSSTLFKLLVEKK